MEYQYVIGGEHYAVQVEAAGDHYSVTVNGQTYWVKASQARPGELDLEMADGRRCLARVAADGANRWVALAANAMVTGRTYVLAVPETRRGWRHGPSGGQTALQAQ